MLSENILLVRLEKGYPANANLERLNIGLRGEHSLSASLSETSRSSLPLGEERRRFGVGTTGELAATMIFCSTVVQVESSNSTSSSLEREGVLGMMGSVEVLCGAGLMLFNAGGEGAHTSVGRRRRGDLDAWGAFNRGIAPVVGLYVNLDRRSFICDEIAALNTVSGSGLPWEDGDMRVPGVSWDCPVLPLEKTVD